MAKTAPFVRNPYNYDPIAASNESGLHCEDASLAQQQFKEECDINTIMQKFAVTGMLPDQPLTPRYGDFTGINDYHTALNQVIAAEDEFMSLPANIRARFENDPAQLIEFLNNEENKEEAVKLGLINKPIEELPQVVEIPQEIAGE